LGLFSNIYQNSVQRQQTLFDRFTDENIYNRNISPVLYNFLPQFGNVTPYGVATPNRRGVSLGLATDTSLKLVDAEFGVDLLSEIIGESTPDLRKYTVIKGGASINIHKIINWKKRFVLMGGIRNESTTRNGQSSVDFKSTLVDAGLAVEFIKNVEIMGGLKLLNASGNEYTSSRDQFNLISVTPSLLNLKVNQLIYSAGVKIRFTDRSFFIVNYNVGGYKDLLNDDKSYSNNQLFFNYTLSL
ncbi:MAG: hypothetical protein K2Q22_02900, partial [Cytophagales bacterium]|nr:hypothetical protein [Cytophagales bacterium]